MAKKRGTVRIVNPQGARYTSFKAAQALVARRRAAWVEPGRSIELLSQTVIQADVTLNRRVAYEDDLKRNIDRYRPGGVIWWNGSDHDPSARHRPGEVCS